MVLLSLSGETPRRVGDGIMFTNGAGAEFSIGVIDVGPDNDDDVNALVTAVELGE